MMIVNVLAGLAIFFFGVAEMTRGLRSLTEGRLQAALTRLTKNRVTGVLTGTLATIVVDSSSIVTIMTVGLVSAGLLSFANALAVVLGANIGTTISSQVIAFGLTDFFGIVLVAGAALRFLPKGERMRPWGVALMGLGFVFLGLEQIESAVEPVAKSELFLNALRRLENPFLGMLIGAVITAVIQSSSATMAIVIVLATQGAISLPAGIAVMMGAELGTCADTLCSTIGQSRAAIRVGVFHLLFNALNVLLLLGFATQLAQLSTALTPGTGPERIARQIANAHVAFNVIGVLAALPFTRFFAQLMERLIPDGEQAPALNALPTSPPTT